MDLHCGSGHMEAGSYETRTSFECSWSAGERTWPEHREAVIIVTISADGCSQFGLELLRWVQDSGSVLFIICLWSDLNFLFCLIGLGIWFSHCCVLLQRPPLFVSPCPASGIQPNVPEQDASNIWSLCKGADCNLGNSSLIQGGRFLLLWGRKSMSKNKTWA